MCHSEIKLKIKLKSKLKYINAQQYNTKGVLLKHLATINANAMIMIHKQWSSNISQSYVISINSIIQINCVMFIKTVIDFAP